MITYDALGDRGFNYWKRTPLVAKVRAKMVKIYRDLRAERPEMARLLYKRERYCRLLLSGVGEKEAREIVGL